MARKPKRRKQCVHCKRMIVASSMDENSCRDTATCKTVATSSGKRHIREVRPAGVGTDVMCDECGTQVLKVLFHKNRESIGTCFCPRTVWEFAIGEGGENAYRVRPNL